MGDVNQLRFVERYAGSCEGPFLEAGSKDYGNTQPLRPLFAGRGEYIGVDREPGPGVDVVLDLLDDFDRIDAGLGHRRFGTIFCLSVLEHCREPFAMADHLARLLRPGGQIFVSAPFAFKIHAYPSDYWRFTPEGIRALFPSVDFRPEDAFWGTTGLGTLHPESGSPGAIPFSFKAHWRAGRPFRAISAKLLRVLGRLGPLRWLASTRYVLAPTDIMMMGRQGAAAAEAAD